MFVPRRLGQPAGDREFGDGFFDTGPSPTHTYGFDGNFVVTLTVSDEGGRTATVTKTVIIDP